MNQFRRIIAALLVISCPVLIGSSSAETVSYGWAANELSTAEELGLFEDISNA